MEDSTLLRTQIVRALEETGVLTVIGFATRADVALQEIAAIRPDVLVVDLQLEQGTGWDVIEGSEGIAGRTMILTNHGSEQFRAVAKERGIREFYDKTSEFDLFLQEVRSRPLNVS